MRSILSTIACAYQHRKHQHMHCPVHRIWAEGTMTFESWYNKMCTRVHCSCEGKYLFLSFFLKVAVTWNVNSIPLPSRVHLWSIKNKNSLISKGHIQLCHTYKTATWFVTFSQSQKIIVPDFSLSISPYRSLMRADFIIFWFTCSKNMKGEGSIRHPHLTDLAGTWKYVPMHHTHVASWYKTSFILEPPAFTILKNVHRSQETGECSIFGIQNTNLWLVSNVLGTMRVIQRAECFIKAVYWGRHSCYNACLRPSTQRISE